MYYKIELSNENCGQTERMRLIGEESGETAVAINRHRNTVSNYLKDPDNYGCIKHSGHIPTVDQRIKWRIRHLAINENMSCRQIKVELGLIVRRQRIQQYLKHNIGLRCENKITETR
uniref:Tc3 transposase DNA binding domain-containing protein n=1 Tax=Glossina austeni TaxID=7395 RepID=A0A1A9UD70_GLOAU